jgi:U3 small nucleolar RNA-associated protein 13
MGPKNLRLASTLAPASSPATSALSPPSLKRQRSSCHQGADGLLKLWSLRTGECANTFDGHDDRAWALAAGGKHESLLATGGADARVVIWCVL